MRVRKPPSELSGSIDGIETRCNTLSIHRLSSLSASSQFNRTLDVSTTNQSRSFSSALAVIDESSYLPPLRVVGRRIFSNRKIYLYAFQCENILRRIGFWKQRDGTPRASQRQVDIWGLFIFCRAPNGDTSHLLRASIHT